MLQSSGSISTGDIAAEFGGSAPHSISEYYRGAGLVADVVENEGVPTSGAIKRGDFYGAAKNYVNLQDHSITATTGSPGDASASIAYRPKTDYDFGELGVITDHFTTEGYGEGDIVNGDSGDNAISDSGREHYEDDWVNTHSDTGRAASDFEIRATVNSGDTPTGASVATWLALSTERTWTVSASTASPAGSDSASCELLIEIRDASTETVFDSCTVSLSASVSAP